MDFPSVGSIELCTSKLAGSSIDIHLVRRSTWIVVGVAFRQNE
jgi:hypothetical protein